MDAVDPVVALVSGAGGVALGVLLSLMWVLRTRTAARDVVVRLERIEHILTAPDQAWYWTAAWQAGEREVDADLADGSVRVSGSDEELFAALREIPAADEPARSQ